MRIQRHLVLAVLAPTALVTVFAVALNFAPVTAAARRSATSSTAAVVVVTQTNGLTAAAPGSIVTYTVTVTNTGAITANFVRPSDGIIIGSYWLVATPPEDAAIIRYSASGTTGSGFILDPLRPDQVAWVFKLPPLASMAHTVTVRLHPYPCTAAFTNTVRISSFGAGDGVTVDDVDAYAATACGVYLAEVAKE